MHLYFIVMLYSEHTGWDINDIIGQIGDQIRTSYLKQYEKDSDQMKKLVDASVNDIKAYVKELGLESYVNELKEAINTKDAAFTPPHISCPSYQHQVGGKAARGSSEFIVTRNDTRRQMRKSDIHTLYKIKNGKVTYEDITPLKFSDYENSYNEARKKRLHPLKLPKGKLNYNPKYSSVDDYKQNSKAPETHNQVQNNYIIHPPKGIIENNKDIHTMPSAFRNIYNNQNNNFSMQQNVRQNFNMLQANQFYNKFPKPNITVNNANNFNSGNNFNNQNNNYNNNYINNYNFQNLNNNFNNNFNKGFVQNNNFNNGFPNQQNAQMGMNQNFVQNMNMQNMNFQTNNESFTFYKLLKLNMLPLNYMTMPNPDTNLVTIKASPKLRNRSQICNLIQDLPFKNGQTCQTTVNKCYFNSIMQCMANVNVLYEAITHSYRWQKKGNSPEYWLISSLYTFLYACREGTMHGWQVEDETINEYNQAIINLHWAYRSYSALYDAIFAYCSDVLDNKNNQNIRLMQKFFERMHIDNSSTNPRRDHLLSDHFDEDGDENSGYSAAEFMMDILRPLQDQMETCGIQSPTRPIYYLNDWAQPQNEREFNQQLNNENDLYIITNHIRYGLLIIPNGETKLENFNKTFTKALSEFTTSYQLPKVLIYKYDGTKDQNNQMRANNMTLPATISLQGYQGTKEYRLNSFVSILKSDGGHYQPIMRTKQGWVTINSATHEQSAQSAKKYYDEKSGEAVCPMVIFYEQIE